ncbi:MAG: hypothetical protein LCI00_29300 [Chloroflexi bacterium]|nr:hypothetical protein [Chloroflexota bacterium]
MSTENPTHHPARLFVLLARQAPIGVILRRGPKDWVQMIKWHTDTDTFEAGQWLRGTVEEYQGDLSPDGNLFFYSFYNWRLNKALEMQNRQTDKLLFYKAVSKTPYFTALTLWQGIDVPGGQFLDNTTLRLYTDAGLHPTRTVPQLNIVIEHLDINPYHIFADNKDVFLTNNGWELFEKGVYTPGDSYNASPYIWSKALGDFKLFTKYYGYIPDKKQGGAYNQLEYRYSIKGNSTQPLLDGVNWADFDQQGRLVLAKEGKLYAAALTNGELQLTELADFNANKPDPQPAPEWAQKW